MPPHLDATHRRGRPVQDWRTLNPDDRENFWVKIPTDNGEEQWVMRWTQKQLERSPKCVEEFAALIDSETEVTLAQQINWSEGSPHYTVSKFLTYHLRGKHPLTKNLGDDEGFMDLDNLMAEYFPSTRFTVTTKLLGEIIRHSAKKRFTAKVDLERGQPRILSLIHI